MAAAGVQSEAREVPAHRTRYGGRSRTAAKQHQLENLSLRYHHIPPNRGNPGEPTHTVASPGTWNQLQAMSVSCASQTERRLS